MVFGRGPGEEVWLGGVYFDGGFLSLGGLELEVLFFWRPVFFFFLGEGGWGTLVGLVL